MKTLFLIIQFTLFIGFYSYAQNVGIGTTNPIEELHVLGTGLFDNPGTSTGEVRMWSPGGHPGITMYANDPDGFRADIQRGISGLYFRVHGATNYPPASMVIRNTGRIGIGTISPTQLMHISSAESAVLVLEADTDNVTETDHARIEMKQDGGAIEAIVGFAGGSNHLTIQNNYASNDADIEFFTQSNSRMTIDGTGRVGIGTNAPLSTLDVRGGIRWGTAGASLGTGQGANMEMRGTGTPYIDFSNDPTTDFDARIILASNNRLTVQGAELAVLNTISAKRLKVTTTGYPDYVFHGDYQLKTLKEVEQFIQKNGHLPGVPSEKEIVENGLDLNDQSIWQQEKIEELFLHTIQQQKLIEQLIEENKELRKKIK